MKKRKPGAVYVGALPADDPMRLDRSNSGGRERTTEAKKTGKALVMPSNCRDVTADHIGTSFAIIGVGRKPKKP